VTCFRRLAPLLFGCLLAAGWLAPALASSNVTVAASAACDRSDPAGPSGWASRSDRAQAVVGSTFSKAVARADADAYRVKAEHHARARAAAARYAPPIEAK